MTIIDQILPLWTIFERSEYDCRLFHAYLALNILPLDLFTNQASGGMTIEERSVRLSDGGVSSSVQSVRSENLEPKQYHIHSLFLLIQLLMKTTNIFQKLYVPCIIDIEAKKHSECCILATKF